MSEQGSGSFARASNFTEIKITKPNRDIIVESRGKTIGFNYYESVYSPMITATMLELDAGGSVVVEDKDVRGTLKDALPVEGFERVSFVITSVSGEVIHGDKLKFILNKKNCNEVGVFFTFMTTKAPDSIKSLEGE